MAEVLDIPINGYVINFVTLNKVNIYGVYDPNTTSLQKVIDTFYDNYECKNINRNSIDIFSEELNQSVLDFDMNKKMSELKLSQTSKFILKRIPIYIFHNDNNLNYIEEHTKKLFVKINERKNDTMTIFCKTVTGTTITLNVLDDFFVEDIKCLIKHKINTPINAQRIIFAGKELDNTVQIFKCNMTNESTIHMVLPLRGGMYHETSARNGNYQMLKSNIFVIN